MFIYPESTFSATRHPVPQSMSALPMATGIVAGSLIETSQGWRPVETLRVGELVLTYDGGAQAVAALRRTGTGAAPRSQPGPGLILAPGGALDNCADLLLAPDQPVLIHSPAAEAVLGAPGALVKARRLVGFRGIRRAPPTAPRALIALAFETEEMVFVNSGALLHCPARAQGAGAPLAEGGLADGFFPVLDAGRTRALLDLTEAGALDTADLARAA